MAAEFKDSVNSPPLRGAQTITLGMVIDGFFHLSESEKAIFLAATRLCSSEGLDSKPNTAKAVAKGKVSLPKEEIPKTAELQQKAGIVPPGSTVDPSTGKVYRIVPKKEHSDERSRLEASKEKLRLDLVEVCNTYGIYRTEEGPRKYDQNGQEGLALNPVEIRVYQEKVDSFAAAKAALQRYKTAHPEEFQETAALAVSSRGNRGSRGITRGTRGQATRGRGRGNARLGAQTAV